MRCLGTMLKCQARGDTLAFITVTDGSLGFVNRPEIARAEAAAIRHAGDDGPGRGCRGTIRQPPRAG